MLEVGRAPSEALSLPSTLRVGAWHNTSVRSQSCVGDQTLVRAGDKWVASWAVVRAEELETRVAQRLHVKAPGELNERREVKQ